MEKEELKSEIRSAYQAFLKELKALKADEFYVQKNGKWSPAQNMAHLTLSAKLFLEL
jgi:hypothetical protein